MEEKNEGYESFVKITFTGESLKVEHNARIEELAIASRTLWAMVDEELKAEARLHKQ